MENKELTYNGIPVVIKQGFVVTDFGEVSIQEIQKEYDNTVKERNVGLIIDSDYLYELEAILEQYKNLY